MIRCQGLQWGSKGQPLTSPLDLYLPTGSLTAVIGKNGSGKSSLLKVLAGLDQPLRGRVDVGAPLLGGVSYLPQQQTLDRQFPIRLTELVSAGLWRSRLPRRERQIRLQQAVEEWGLLGLENQSLQALSGGELQRALLARLGVTGAQVLLLDEPEAALDEAGKQLLWQHIDRWRQQGKTLVVVSHDVDSLRRRLESALLVSSTGCIATPIAQMPASLSRLEHVA